MSLNDYFAANGAVYLRPVGLPDCFPMPGLPHGCKPPPLAMQHPCNPPQKPRTMAAVSPLHQVVPPQAPPIPSYEGGNMGFNATPRTSSFAAALRKLAKQAVDPVTGEKDLSQISPVSSPVLNQTPKRNVPSSSMFHQGAFASTSPPVVTIAPSRPVATHTSDSRKQVMDLSTVQNNTSLSNGHIQEPIAVKMDSSKSGPRPAHAEKWEEPSLPSKGHSASSASSQVRPHATIAPLPRPDDSLTSSRGFQPYRGSEESRNTLPHHISLFDHHPTAVSYPYSPAFLPPSHLSHPAYRFDDPLYLERYSLLRPPVMPYPQPGIMAPPAAFYPNSRYATDLIAQSLSLGGANNGMLNHERLKQEEERRMREKEIELDQSRNKEQERQKEKEQKEKESREREREQKERELREKEKREKDKSHREKEDKTEHTEHKKERSSSSHSSSSKRTESPSVRPSTTVHNSSFHAVPTTSSSTPLNLVMQQHQAAQQHPEQQKKETELWMPWQQPVNHHPKENNSQDAGNSMKHPAFRPMENQNHQPVKENHTNEKVPLRFSPTILNEKKSHNPPPPVLQPNETKKYPTEQKKFDSIHHHITELSSKDHGPHEWRHEKLQKACTNNHKKSHDSKKAKEAMASHQRKAVNGAILKQQTFQNEGMHARLLESEKVRIEMNGQMQAKPQQNVINVTNYKPNYPPVINKEMSVSKTYLECYTPVTAPVVKSTVDLTPVVSKLDLEAKNLLKGDTKLYEDDEKAELRLRNFLIITKGPPLKLETSAPKLKFLKILGLTTHYKRKKVELDMYLKRRKILFEDSMVPPLSPETEEDKKSLPPPPLIEYSIHTERLAEQLRSETKPEKLEFFFQLGLTPITLVKKEERERIRRVVEEERMRRHYRMLAKMNKKASPRRLFVPKSEAAMKLDHLRKMREQNALFANNMYSKSSQEDEVFTDSSSSASTQMVMPKHEQVPYLSSSDTANASSGKDGSESPYPHTKSFNKYSFKRGHSLKNEFRYEMPRPASKNNHTLLSSLRTDTNSVSVSTQVDSSLLALGAESTLAALRNSVNWPGLESIMEAFYRHQHDQSNEKTILTERCHKLRKTQEELKKEADGLTKQMSETLKCKRDLDEETFKLQRAIDRIKQCLQPGR